MKKKWISVLAIGCMACCLGAGMQLIKVDAEDYADAVTCVKGAYVRVDTTSPERNGIRFQATVDGQIYADLEGSENIQKKHMLEAISYRSLDRSNYAG